MDPLALLTALAGELWDQSNRHATAVLARQSPDASPVPFGPFIFAQRALDGSTFHLPEPLLHPVAVPAVLVVGLNPGYGASEVMPHLGTPLSDYVAWYADRFAPSRRDDRGRPLALYREGRKEILRPIPHYVKVEALLEPAIGAAALGRSAVYGDAIPWKWNNRDKELRPHLSTAEWSVVWESARSRLCRIAEGLRPQLVLTLGEPGARVFNRPRTDPPRSCPAVLGDWSGQHLAAAHPNARGKTRDYWQSVARALAAGLGASTE